MALLGNKGPSTFSLKTSGMPSPSGRGEPYLLKRPNVSFASPSEDLHSKGIWLPKSTTNLSQERLPCCLSASLHFGVNRQKLKSLKEGNKQQRLECPGDVMNADRVPDRKGCNSVCIHCFRRYLWSDISLISVRWQDYRKRTSQIRIARGCDVPSLEVQSWPFISYYL